MNSTIAREKTTTENERDSLDVVDKLLCIRYFLPLLSSLGALLGFCIGGDFFSAIGLVMIAVGTLSALTVCPLKLLAFPFKCVGVGFTFCRGFIPFYGVADLVAAIVGTTCGFMFGLVVVLFAPAIFTIKKFCDEN